MMKTIRPIAGASRQLPPLFSSAWSSHYTQAVPSLYANHQSTQTRRNFISPSSFNLNPFPATQTLTAHRTIFQPRSAIYSVISDVGAYSSFLPFCRESIVTKLSSPAHDGKTYPEEAKLVIGFNDSISESFTSRVYCVPERVVEAVSGATMTSLADEEIEHHGRRPPAEQDSSRNEDIMAQLRTRWTLTTVKDAAEGGRDKTDVDLVIEFQFTNPLYAAMSATAAPKVAEKMIEAFENRVEAVIGNKRHQEEL